ncbi:MAG: YhcH/YjgK/YiaL family protein [bacterium]|jgi:biofilm protein TabA
MIIDNCSNFSTYSSIHPLFPKAFAYINGLDLHAIESGKFEIDGDQLKAIVSSKVGMKPEESMAKFECHDQHIDIQVCITGNETFGWKPRSTCVEPRGEYNAEKDVLFFNDKPDMFFELSDNQFAIFFPDDVHAPMIGEGEIKKIVIKVKI